MEYRILGPLEVADRDREVLLGGGRQRSLLALLLLHANEVVSSERLIDELWGDAPPPTAAKTVQVYVSQLRKALHNGDPHGPLLTRGRGYVIKVAPGELDVERFERALADGRAALDGDAPERAAERLRDGLALWRGPPLADFEYEPFAQADITRLEQLRLAAVEERIEADLALGRHAEVAGELESLVADHPLREGLRRQLMLALYRCNRQAEALEVFRDGRRRLVDELGIEPSASLRELHDAILAQDPGLGAPAWRPPLPVRSGVIAAARRPRTLIVTGAALVAAALTVVALQLLREDPGPARPAVPLRYSALAAVSAAGAVEAAVALPGVSRVAITDGLAWVGGDDSRTVSAVSTRTRRLVRTVPTGLFPSDIAAGEGSVWVVDGARGQVVRIQPSYGRILDRWRFRPSGEAPPDRFGFDPTSIAVGAGAAWITDGGERLLRIGKDGSRDSIPMRRSLIGVAVGAGGVWVISGETTEIVRVDPRTRAVTARFQIVDRPELRSAYPRAIAVTADAVWVLNGNTGAVTRIDPVTRTVVSTTRVGVERVPVRLDADGDAAWVANEDGTLARVDADTEAVDFFDVGRTLRDVAVGGGAVWASNRLADCCGQEE
ncbi:MAG TPA: BTAD domain-containing putative transcriptional regulator [Solirubrobacteraceae bacterium]|nr:BTAD domain-containing putative transcriptional regulator [Solirubrobacteraceae bacterium]